MAQDSSYKSVSSFPIPLQQWTILSTASLMTKFAADAVSKDILNGFFFISVQ